MRLIDADALKEKLQENHDFIINAWKENGVAPIYISVPDKSRLDEIINSIAEVVNAPTIEERPKGKWVIGETYDCHSDIIKTYTCPFCGIKEYSKYPFCHCGADMRKEDPDEK